MKFTYRRKEFDFEGISDSDHIYASIVARRTFYEIDLLEYIYALRDIISKPHSIAIDVGANIGNHSVYFQTFLTENVISVEPNPDVFHILERNARTNIRNYKLYPNGLGETEDRGIIVIPHDSNNNIGMAKIVPGNSVNTIKIITLDQMWDDWIQTQGKSANVTIIKVDVEGMELAVLKGAINTIEKYRPQLFLEAVTVSDFRRLEEYLEPKGYKAICHWGVTPVYHFAHKPSRRLLFASRRYSFMCRLKKKIGRMLQ